MAYELDLEGEHIRLMRVVDTALAEALGPNHPRIHVNVDGAMAAICGDIGLDHEFGNALFIISRVPGLIAHAHEEKLRERPIGRSTKYTTAQPDSSSESAEVGRGEADGSMGS